MDEKEIKKFIEDTIKGTFSQIELSSKLKELDELKETNKQLVAKLASVEEAEIPAEKVEEITEIVDKAIGDKVDTAIGEALADVIDRVEAVESSMTDRQRIKKALSGKKSPFKAMSRPAKAFTSAARGFVISDEDGHILDKTGTPIFPDDEFYTTGKDLSIKVFPDVKSAEQFLRKVGTTLRDTYDISADELEIVPISDFVGLSTKNSNIDVEKELNAISDKLKCAKDKKEIEEVKNLLQAFMSSASKKIKLSAEEDNAELEAYRELGTIDEIEAAVEVLETYAEEIGSLPELEAPEEDEEEAPEGEEEFEELDIEAFASKRRKALASKRKQAFASKRRQALRKKMAVASKKKATQKVNNSSKRVERLKTLKEKSMKLSSLKAKENTNKVELSSTSKEVPGALASALFSRK